MDSGSRRGGFGGNVLWTWVDVLAGLGQQLALVGVGARVLGAETFGVYALVVGLTLVVTAAQYAFSLVTVGAAARVLAGTGAAEDLAQVQAGQAAFSVLGLLTAGLSALGGLVVVFCGFSTAGVPGRPASSASSLQVAALVALVGFAVAAAFVGSAAGGVARGATDYRLATGGSVAGKVATIALAATLLPRLGLPALGVAQLIGNAISAAVVTRGVRRYAPWFTLDPRGASRDAVRRVLGLAGPLLLVTLATQTVNALQLVLLSAVAGVAATGVYQLGTTLPNRASLAVFQGFDVAFPYLASTQDPVRQERATRLVTTAFSLLAGVGFGVMIGCAGTLGRLLAGEQTYDPVIAVVVVLFSLLWLINTAVHGAALLVISRGQQSLLARITLGEAAANIILTLAGVLAFGVVGAAVASLVSVGVSNAVATPWLLRRRSSLGYRFILVDGVLPGALGLGCGLVGTVIAATALDGLARVAVALLAGMVLLSVVAIVGYRGRRSELGFLRSPEPGDGGHVCHTEPVES